jgi:hypothetical protein
MHPAQCEQTLQFSLSVQSSLVLQFVVVSPWRILGRGAAESGASRLSCTFVSETASSRNIQTVMGNVSRKLNKTVIVVYSSDCCAYLRELVCFYVARLAPAVLFHLLLESSLPVS